MRSAVFLLGLFFISPAALAESAPAYITPLVPKASEAGSGRLTYLLWDVYDARLFVPQGKWSDEPPYALELRYLRDLDGGAIADRSAEEIRKQGFRDEVTLAAWHTQMRKLFPNVHQGSTLTGIYTAKGESLFYLSDQFIGKITDPSFGKHFFAIWLSEKTSEPQLRRRLLGL